MYLTIMMGISATFNIRINIRTPHEGRAKRQGAIRNKGFFLMTAPIQTTTRSVLHALWYGAISMQYPDSFRRQTIYFSTSISAFHKQLTTFRVTHLSCLQSTRRGIDSG